MKILFNGYPGHLSEFFRFAYKLPVLLLAALLIMSGSLWAEVDTKTGVAGVDGPVGDDAVGNGFQGGEGGAGLVGGVGTATADAGATNTATATGGVGGKGGDGGFGTEAGGNGGVGGIGGAAIATATTVVAGGDAIATATANGGVGGVGGNGTGGQGAALGSGGDGGAGGAATATANATNTNGAATAMATAVTNGKGGAGGTGAAGDPVAGANGSIGKDASLPKATATADGTTDVVMKAIVIGLDGGKVTSTGTGENVSGSAIAEFIVDPNDNTKIIGKPSATTARGDISLSSTGAGPKGSISNAEVYVSLETSTAALRPNLSNTLAANGGVIQSLGIATALPGSADASSFIDGNVVVDANGGNVLGLLTLGGGNQIGGDGGEEFQSRIDFILDAPTSEQLFFGFFDPVVVGSGNGFTELDFSIMVEGIDITTLSSFAAFDVNDDDKLYVLDLLSIGGVTGQLDVSFIFNLTAEQEDPSGFYMNAVFGEQFTAVPLPVAFWLFASGLVGLTGLAVRKNKISAG